MDAVQLSEAITSVLVPMLPYLVLASEKASEEFGKQFGLKAWEKVKSIWNRLYERIETKPAAREATEDAAKNPQDNDTLASFRLQIRKLLDEDVAFAAEIAQLLDSIDETERNKIKEIRITQAQDRSIAIGGSVSNSHLTTGDTLAEKRKGQD